MKGRRKPLDESDVREFATPGSLDTARSRRGTTPEDVVDEDDANVETDHDLDIEAEEELPESTTGIVRTDSRPSIS